MLNAYIIADKIRITPIKLKKYTVEPPVSDEPKLQRLSGRLPEVVAYKDRTTGANGGGGGGASSEKRSGPIYFMEDNLLHAIYKLHRV